MVVIRRLELVQEMMVIQSFETEARDSKFGPAGTLAKLVYHLGMSGEEYSRGNLNYPVKWALPFDPEPLELMGFLGHYSIVEDREMRELGWSIKSRHLRLE